MKNLSCLVLTCFLLQLNAQIASWNWAKGAGFEKLSSSKICIDASGNSYLIGWYTNTLSISNATFVQPNSIESAGYYCKLDPSGNVLSVFNFTNGSVMLIDAICDSQGNSYIAGYSPSAHCIIGTYTLGAQNNKGNVFLMKLDPNGNLLWLQSSERGGVESSKVWLNGNDLYWAGVCSGTFVVASTTVTSSYIYGDYFLTKYDLNGNFYWLKSGGGEKIEMSVNLCSDNNGDVYLSCVSQSTLITVGSSTFTGSNIGSNGCVFLAKYDSNGSFLWGKSFAPAGNATVTALSSPNSGFSLAGRFVNSFTIGNTTLNSQNITGYVGNFDSNGILQWIDSFNTGAFSSIDDISTDVFGNIYALGTFSGSSTSIQNLSLQNDSTQKSLFLGIFSSNGQIQNASKIGSKFEEAADDICIDPNGNLAIVGHYKGPYTVIGSNTITNNNYYAPNPKPVTFIAKTAGPMVGIEKYNFSDGVHIYPNPATDRITILNPPEQSEYEIIDTQGKIILVGNMDTDTINIDSLPNGIYLLNVTDSRNVKITKLVIQR